MGITRFERKGAARAIPGDWYPGTVPEGVRVHPEAYVGSSNSFVRYRSELPVGVHVGRGASLCDATSLDIGPGGCVRLGAFALVTAARIVCDAEVDIGDYALVSWDVILMDSYRVAPDPAARRRWLSEGRRPDASLARPIRIGRNSWVGFGVCILPGVSVGDGSVVAARSVVATDVPPGVVVAGNPARIVRHLSEDEPLPP